MVNIYIDDIRKAPKGFLLAKNYNDAIDLIEKNKDNLNIVSFDHDLGCFVGGKEYTGYDIALYMCENSISPKTIRLNTANIVGRKNMYQLFEGAKRRGFITYENIYID